MLSTGSNIALRRGSNWWQTFEIFISLSDASPSRIFKLASIDSGNRAMCLYDWASLRVQCTVLVAIYLFKGMGMSRTKGDTRGKEQMHCWIELWVQIFIDPLTCVCVCVCVCVFFQTLFFSSFFCENKSFKGWKKGRATRYTRENSWINKCQSVRRQTSFETRFQPIHILYSVHTNTTGGRFHPLEKGLNRTPATMMCYDLTP